MPIPLSQMLKALQLEAEVIHENNKHPFLHPDTDATPLELPERTVPAEYLRIGMQNIRAEFAAFLEKVDPAPHRICITSSINDGDDPVSVITEIHKLHSGSDDPPEKLKQFNRHLLCIGQPNSSTFNLCITSLDSKVRPKGLHYITGAIWTKLYNRFDKHKVRSGECLAYDFGYIGDFQDEMYACEDITTALNNGSPPPLLEAVADPTKRLAYARDPPTVPTTTTTPTAASTANVPINASQSTIVDNLNHEIECIQGPPGTGKSTTIFHILQRDVKDNEVALVTCVQNKAVEAVAEKLANNIGFFVYGLKDRLTLVAQMWTLESQVDRDADVVVAQKHVDLVHSQWDAFDSIINEKEAQALNSDARTRRRVQRSVQLFPQTTRDFQENRDDYVANDPWRKLWVWFLSQRYQVIYTIRSARRANLNEANGVLMTIRQRAHDRILVNTRAVLCTVSSTGGMVRWGGEQMVGIKKTGEGTEEVEKFSERIRTVILDEAGTTPECKIPILLCLPIDRIIAIGDQKQLAPFTHIESTKGHSKIKYCNDYQRGRCSYFNCNFVHKKRPEQVPKALGFFQRVEQALPYGAVPMLTLQYRMHPNIADIVSELFYSNLVQTPDVIAEARRNVDVQGMWCLDVHGQEVFPSERNKSCTNPAEIDKVYQTYLLVKENNPNKTIMIITFYKAQQRDMVKAFKDAGEVESPTLRITTVDQSQGSEADSVILSTVRCNNKHNIGFVQNENRMNVAISRARDRLIVVGDRNTFVQNPNWKKIWNACVSYPLHVLPARR